MQSWIGEMCRAVKAGAPRQLVGIGSEGFLGNDSPLKAQNPADWAGNEGQNFVANAQDPCVDYVGIHVWPGAAGGGRARSRRATPP